MLTVALLLIIVTAIVFVIAFISPKHGTRVQQKSGRAHNKVKAKTSTSSELLKHAAVKSSRLSHKTVTKSAEAGKKSRKKLL